MLAREPMCQTTKTEALQSLGNILTIVFRGSKAPCDAAMVTMAGIASKRWAYALVVSQEGYLKAGIAERRAHRLPEDSGIHYKHQTSGSRPELPGS